ncbi:hypothetical protein [Acidocella facilis]|uniref:hypothetical protein n=1 Tax=Acidocella facilis TaxID=525 RepID=UPI0012DD761E|nr:hypothetical protein [Acidocella facilis]
MKQITQQLGVNPEPETPPAYPFPAYAIVKELDQKQSGGVYPAAKASNLTAQVPKIKSADRSGGRASIPPFEGRQLDQTKFFKKIEYLF